MKVCVVGGIFGREQEYREKHKFAPEVVLADGLRERGVTVETRSHGDFRPDGKWDLIHVHHLAEGAVRAASSEGTVPLVFTSHEPKIINDYERSLPRKSAFNYVVRRADALVALSTKEVQYLEERCGVKNRAVIIPNGIRADIFRVQPEGERAPTPTLVFAGQLIPMKGVDVLLRALAIIPGWRRPRLLLVYQNAMLEKQLRALSSRLGVDESVEFVGFLGAEALAKVYAQADALVLPSYGEGLPSVITEAMLCGLPVIATAVGGIPDQLGPDGLLVRPGDVDGLADAIEKLLARLPLNDEQRRSLRAKAQEHSAVPRMIDAHLSLYERLLQRGRRGRRVRGLFDRAAHAAIDLYRAARNRQLLGGM